MPSIFAFSMETLPSSSPGMSQDKIGLIGFRPAIPTLRLEFLWNFSLTDSRRGLRIAFDREDRHSHQNSDPLYLRCQGPLPALSDRARNEPRDLYDLWHLFGANSRANYGSFFMGTTASASFGAGRSGQPGILARSARHLVRRLHKP